MRGRLVVAFLVGLATIGCAGEETSTPGTTERVAEQSATDPSRPTEEPEPTMSSPGPTNVDPAVPATPGSPELPAPSSTLPEPAAAEGSVVVWGDEGLLPDGEDYVAVGVGRSHGVALKADGSIVGWGGYGRYGHPEVPPPGNDYIAIDAGGDYDLALTRDGSIIGWGTNWYPVALPPPAGNDYVAIAAGGENAIALRRDGSITGWGNAYEYGEMMPPPGNDFVAISTYGDHSLALRADGSIAGWGRFNAYGEATPPPGNNYVAVSAGGGHSLALRADGSIVGWGDNEHGQATPPPGNDYVHIEAGGYHSLALTSHGSIVGWGSDLGEQTTPPPGSSYTALAAGTTQSVAVKHAAGSPGGHLVGWGWEHIAEPMEPPPGDDHVAMSAGHLHGLALERDGSIVAWGSDGGGQASPPPGNDNVAVAAGSWHSLALRADGSIVGWGNNSHGQASPPAGNDYTAIAAGLDYGLALRADGSIVGWGNNSHGQASPPAGTDHVELAAGRRHSLALKSDGSMVAWGLDRYGRLAPPVGDDYIAIAAGGAFSAALMRAALFEPVTPHQLEDTRQGYDHKIGAKIPHPVYPGDHGFMVPVTGRAGVPGAGVGAVSLNVTVTETELPSQGDGYVTVHACTEPVPDARHLTFGEAQTVAEAVIAPVSANGYVCFSVSGLAHLIVDINGYFPAGSDFASATWPASTPPMLRQGDHGPWVAILQQQLSRHGHPLEVDGIYGPATRAAVHDLQTAHELDVDGIVGPRTWAALADPATSTIPTGTTSPGVVLRADGLGPHSIGSPISVVEPWLTEALGPPKLEEADPMVLTCVRFGCSDARLLRWPAAGLLVAFSDTSDAGENLDEPVLSAWTVTSGSWHPDWVYPGQPISTEPVAVRLMTAEGVGLGTTAEQLQAALPSTVLFAWNDSSLVPTGFYIADETGHAALQGDLAWNVVEDIQSALNANGADLAVDGIAGPRTVAALAKCHDETGGGDWRVTFAALGLATPDHDAPVIRLSAGDWFWELECGSLNALGLVDRC